MTRLTGLVEALLHEAQIASGRLAPQVEDVDVGEIARTVVEEQRPQAEEKGLAMRLEAEEHVPWVQTEPRFLRLILSNLVGNVELVPVNERAPGFSGPGARHRARGSVSQIGQCHS